MRQRGQRGYEPQETRGDTDEIGFPVLNSCSKRRQMLKPQYIFFLQPLQHGNGGYFTLQKVPAPLNFLPKNHFAPNSRITPFSSPPPQPACTRNAGIAVTWKPMPGEPTLRCWTLSAPITIVSLSLPTLSPAHLTYHRSTAASPRSLRSSTTPTYHRGGAGASTLYLC